MSVCVMDDPLQVPALAKRRSRRTKSAKKLSPSSEKSPVISVADIFNIARDVLAVANDNDVYVNDVIEEDDELLNEDYIFEYERNNNASPKSSYSLTGGAPKIVQHRQQLLNPHKWKHLLKKQEAITANRTAAKQNIEKELAKKGLHRLGPAVFERAWCDQVETQSSGSNRKLKTRRSPVNNGDSLAVLQHALQKSHLKESSASSHLLKIADMQHRDITPEDYELLLQLDDDVAPKTVSQELLKQLHTAASSEFGLAGELCSICMEQFRTKDLLKKLLCGHCFHSSCVDQWLTYSSCACPLDGLLVVQ